METDDSFKMYEQMSKDRTEMNNRIEALLKSSDKSMDGFFDKNAAYTKEGQYNKVIGLPESKSRYVRFIDRLDRFMDKLYSLPYRFYK
ncbi:MAG: hypothetical protein M1348_00970 [Candidatus Parvarchaeota archaeon]|nr:hypothetical protein [Candidatus Parvarchaeota archaeon]MCL5101169.1 hypothetical protein [Candidatus Parvarchaeota archaeon]